LSYYCRRRRKLDRLDSIRYNLTINAYNFLEDSIVLKNRSIFPIAMSVFGCASIFTSTQVLAQYNYYESGSFYSNINNYPPIDGGKRWKSPSNSSSAKVKKQPKSPIAASNNQLPYTRDRNLSSKIREEYLQDLEQRLPGSIAPMRTLLTKNDVVQTTAKFIQREGLDSGTMEGLMSYWFGQAWAVANQQPFPTPQQYQGIAKQIQTSTSKSSKLSKLSNTERQIFFEELAYRLFEQRATYRQALESGDTGSTAKIARQSQAGLTKLGLNFKGKKLNDSGFQ
jgi:hypothetical protein